MLDHYWDGAVDRISPEAPVPVLRLTGERFAAGGAANVAVNLAALGAGVTLLAPLGVDDAAVRLGGLMAQHGVAVACVAAEGYRTTRKIRFTSRRQQLLRADIEELRSTLTDDPFRAVQTLAGVNGSDDYRSDFSIRAARFDHLSVTLDGIPSSLLVHTVHQATDTGSLAMINSDVLDGASVLFGSYPQRYGNRTGSPIWAKRWPSMLKEKRASSAS